MTTDVKDKEEIETNKNSRKSYVKKDNLIKEKKLVPTTITFKNSEHRMLVTDYYTNIGFTTLNDYIMALVKLSMNDKDITSKLKDILNSY